MTRIPTEIFRSGMGRNGESERKTLAGGVLMGLIVDGVSDVVRVSRDVVEPPPQVPFRGIGNCPWGTHFYLVGGL